MADKTPNNSSSKFTGTYSRSAARDRLRVPHEPDLVRLPCSHRNHPDYAESIPLGFVSPVKEAQL